MAEHGGGKRRHYYTRRARRAGIVVAALASAMLVVMVFPTLQQPCSCMSKFALETGITCRDAIKEEGY